MSELNKSIQYIKGVGPSRAAILKRLGIETVEDLLYFFPRRYEDRSQLIPIKNICVGEWHTIQGEVLAKGSRGDRFGRKKILEVAVGDETGKVFAIWFNQPYLESYFKSGKKVVLYGKVGQYRHKRQMIAPDFELIEEDDQGLNTGRIVPIYSLTKGVSQRYLRKIIAACLDKMGHQVIDALPAAIRQRHGLSDLSHSIHQLHFPDTLADQDRAQQRIAFEEFFFFQIAVLLRRRYLISKKGVQHTISASIIDEFQSCFSFDLTDDQVQAIKDIMKDMKKNTPMLRLLQGDVGSGKTVVSFFGCIAAYANGFQSAIMAPTEILARQHYVNFCAMVQKAPFKNMRVALLNSALKKKEREAVLHDLAQGNIDVVIGTHALIQDDVAFHNLSYVVIDEQHKFGVQQRAVLSSKGRDPDVLVMTATPIPRTLCLTLYGDLDVSTIKQMPRGRGTIKTYLFHSDQHEKVYHRVREWVDKGTQAYIVYPLVDESDTLDLKSAVDMFKRFVKKEFKGLRVGLVHGQMDRKETQQVMTQFKKHQLDILVTTTVLEVGIDVPNANVMVIEHAERFGLSQLHQLRGRIGRGEKNAICVLIGEPKTDSSQQRLEAMLETTDGFKLAELDLTIRGPGQYFGRHQHGLNELSVVNPVAQADLLQQARQEALLMMKSDPQLQTSSCRRIKSLVTKRFPQYLHHASAG